jgi:branched-chain amino acid transport system substrate-binding protein
MARERDRHEPWRVGVLFSQTGVTAVIGETQLRGTLLAIDEVNAAGGIDGRELSPVSYDPASLWTRVGLSNAAGGFDVIRESRRAVTPDPYLVSH